VAALVTTSGSQTVVVAETSANDAAAARTQLLSKLFGANVLNAKPPDITATKNAPTAKVLAIYLSSSPTRRRFETPAPFDAEQPQWTGVLQGPDLRLRD
jgi:hypothetical protein